MNIDLLMYNTNEKTNDYIDNIIGRSFLPIITKPTRITPTTATLLDHIYTNKSNIPMISAIIVNDISDHFGTFHIQMKQNQANSRSNSKAYLPKRIFNETNINTFNELLTTTNFHPVLQSTCPESSYDKFITLYKEAFDKAFPLKHVKLNKNFVKKEPWMTEGLLTSMRKKHKLLQKKTNKPTSENIYIYKTFNNLYNKTKKAMKKKYYHNLLQENQNNIKETWNIIKQILQKQNKKMNYPNFFRINNNNISDKKVIADSFNNFFSTIGKITSKAIPKSKKHYSNYLTNPHKNSMFLEPISASDVLEVVRKMKSKNSSGHDEISTNLVKQSVQNIIIPLTHMINTSLTHGIFPKNLKIAKVIPIYKSNDQKDIKNYRPISLLPAFSKIYEKIVFNKLFKYLDSQGLFYKHQYGFRPNHSTIHPLLHLINDFAQSNNQIPKKYTLAILCDLSKAFDVINREILMEKLQYYGIRGLVGNWLLSYLSDRYQYVKIDNFESKISEVEYGVPQGSILGPLLYLIYVNDIGKSVNANILSFADDTSLYFSDDNVQNLYDTANTEMGNLYEWFCANQLSLNITKTKYIFLIGQSKKYIEHGNICVNGIQLERVGKNQNEESTKFLGIQIDENLSWRNHLLYINNKISRSLHVIKQIRYQLPTSSLRTLYFSMIHPHLTYGLLAWGAANQSLLHKTFLLQKRAIRIISNAPYNSHTEPLFKKMHILKLYDQYTFGILIFMTKYLRNQLPISFDNTYKSTQQIQTTYQTRQANQLFIQRCDSNYLRSFPLYYFPLKWNEWKDKINHNVSIPTLKKIIKNIIVNKYEHYTKCKNPVCHVCSFKP